jgi:quercetin dioxygenase-like cupin family protein
MRLTRAMTIAPLVLCLAVGGSRIAGAQTAPQQPQHGGAIHTPEQLEWQDGPPSLPKGAQYVLIEGNPAQKGEYFALRLRMPDGYRIPPHWHPVSERVTVISGAFHLGHGDQFDEEDTRALKSGSYFTLPPGSRHYAHMEGETIIQLNSVGPWEINYVNDSDDPRKSRR